LYTYAEIQAAFRASNPAYLGDVISFPSQSAFTTAWLNLENTSSIESDTFETFTNLGKQIRIGYGSFSDIITLTLVQRTSTGTPASGGVPGTNTLGNTNPGQGYGTYYTVTDSSANDSPHSLINGYAQVLVYAL